MENITAIRIVSQQLNNPQLTNPNELVAWMGAMQAQDYEMSKWAVGIRLKSSTLADVEQALQQGTILRTHVMRPTWHLVAAQDIRWMVSLSAKRLRSVLNSYDKLLGITDTHNTQGFRLLEKTLADNRSMTRQELTQVFSREGLSSDSRHVGHYIMRAEVEGIVCSGVDKGKKPTYALLEERVPPQPELHREEALAMFALKYFQSHSPASLSDFVWWSGLSTTEARQAIKLADSELMVEKTPFGELYMHKAYSGVAKVGSVLHLLPAYDEYIISYKNRMPVIDLLHHPKAFSNNGFFRPTIMYNGRIVGCWTRPSGKNSRTIQTSFFEDEPAVSPQLLLKAERRYREFTGV